MTNRLMRHMQKVAPLFIVLLCLTALAIPPQDNRPRNNRQANDTASVENVSSRWRVQPTAPIEVADLDSSAVDLKMPENIKQEVEYDDSLNVYRIGSKIGDSYINTPILMTPEEYRQWSERREREAFFRQKDAEGKCIRSYRMAGPDP